MDIRARDLLSKIRSVKGAENTVIAGGAVRDTHLGVEPKDYDFFVPYEGFINVVQMFKEKDIPLKNHPESRIYKQQISDLKGVYQGMFEGLPIEIMAEAIPNDEDFGQNVVKRFDYGLCMIWYEGQTLIRESDEFISDRDNRRMTLHRLQSLAHLPKAIERFNRLNEKFGNRYYFHSDLIQLKKDKEEGVQTLLNKTLYDSFVIEEPVLRVQPERAARPLAQFIRPAEVNPIPAEIPLQAARQIIEDEMPWDFDRFNN